MTKKLTLNAADTQPWKLTFQKAVDTNFSLSEDEKLFFVKGQRVIFKALQTKSYDCHLQSGTTTRLGYCSAKAKNKQLSMPVLKQSKTKETKNFTMNFI